MQEKASFISFDKNKCLLSALVIKYLIFIIIINFAIIKEVKANKVR